MELLSKDQLRALIENRKGPCISIFLPSHKGAWAPEIRQDQIRFKNLLREVKERLQERGLRNQEIAELTDPIHELIDDDTFWEEQSNGIALFRSHEVLNYFRLPIDFQGLELALVNDRFHIKPLLPLFSAQGHFYILALSRNSLRLLKGTKFGVTEIALPRDVPRSISHALPFEEHEQQAHYSSGRPERGSKRTDRGFDSVYRGGEVDEKNEVERYFRLVDKGLHAIFKDEKAPLVLAGVDYLLPIYRTVNSYRYLVDEGITGNSDERNPEDLHDRAWKIVEPHFLETQKKHIAEYEEYLAKNQASNNLKEIVKAAVEGRIDVLFVANGVQKWGKYDLDKHNVYIHDEPQPEDEDLLDFAATLTILTGGEVHALDQNEIPDNSPIAAIYRFMKISAMGGGTKSK
jgi:hypothetical protein